MKWSFKIGSAFGIELRIHFTFFLILLYGAYFWGAVYNQSAAGAIYGAFLIALLFACVVIHELCHSVMAQHYGAEVQSITLLPIGGVSLLKKMPEDPIKELWVSVVGPLSNIVIGFLLVPVLYLIPNPVGGTFGAFSDVDVLTGISAQALVSYLLFINFALAAFNLIPAFPLDGGRVLRSVLALRMPHAKATQAAVTAGQVFAFILGIAGLLTFNPIWILIAVFIYFGAQQEGAGSEIKDVLSGLRVDQAVTGPSQAVAPEASLGEVATMMMHTYQEDFPVISGDRLVGVLTRSNLVDGLHQGGAAITVAQVMETDFPVVNADAPFSEVYDKINETRIKAVPVLRNGELLGMVTLEHLSQVFMLLTATKKPLIAK